MGRYFTRSIVFYKCPYTSFTFRRDSLSLSLISGLWAVASVYVRFTPILEGNRREHSIVSDGRYKKAELSHNSSNQTLYLFSIMEFT